MQGKPLSAGLALQGVRVAPPSFKRAKPAAKRTKRTASPKSHVAIVRPKPGTFVDGRFDGGPIVLAYKLYTPLGSTRRRLPLVVMLHGCTQTAAGFARSTAMNELADEIGFLVLYPEQAASANLARCWNWHKPCHQRRGAGEPAAIAGLTRHIIDLARANPARVYIAGISAGGAAAAIVGAAYPELYAAVGVHSGLARGTICTLSGALEAMRGGIDPSTATGKTRTPLPTIVFHGDKDSVVHPSNAQGFLSHLRQSNRAKLVERVDRGRSPGGRDYTRVRYRHGAEKVMLEDWTVHGSGHAWSGGSAAGSYTDPAGPDASREMMRFFLTRSKCTSPTKATAVVKSPR